MADGTPTLLVAQPGGTFMRIKCNPEDCHLEDKTDHKSNETEASCVDYQTLGISRMRNQNISTEIIGDLECIVENKVSSYEFKESCKSNVLNEIQIHSKNLKSVSLESKKNNSQLETRKSTMEGHRKNSTLDNSKMIKISGTSDFSNRDQVDGNVLGGNIILGDYDIKTEKDSLLPTYKHFSCRDNSNNCNKEDLKGKNKIETDMNIQNNSFQGKPYALATLDGTIMLVKDEVILW